MAGCPLLQVIKTKPFRIAASVALVLALYAIAGFVAAPKLLRSALMKDIPKSLAVTPTIGEIHVNPLLFQLEIKDFSLAAPDGEKLFGFERLFVDFELSSIWHRAYSFVNIDITAPAVNAIVAKDGTLNLLQLKPKSAPAPANSLTSSSVAAKPTQGGSNSSAHHCSRSPIASGDGRCPLASGSPNST